MGEKIFNFFKKIFGRRAELERKVALLEVDNKLLKKQYGDMVERLDDLQKGIIWQIKHKLTEVDAVLQNQSSELKKITDVVSAVVKNNEKITKQLEELQKKTISERTLTEDKSPSYNQIIDEWLNGEEEKDD